MQICTTCIPSINFSIIHAAIKCSGFILVLIVFWWNRGNRVCTTALTCKTVCLSLFSFDLWRVRNNQEGFFSFFFGFQQKVFRGRGLWLLSAVRYVYREQIWGKNLRYLSYSLKNILCNKSLKKIHCTCNINIFVYNINSPASLLRYTFLVLGWTALLPSELP